MLSFLISLLISVTGYYPVPEGYVTLAEERLTLLYMGLGLMVEVLATLLLLSLLFGSCRKIFALPGSRPLVKAFGGLLALGLMAMAVWVVISMIFGLVSILIQTLARNSLTFDEIAGIIDVLTEILAILIAPVVLCILFAFGLGSGNIRKSITDGLKELRFMYVKTLALCAAFFAAGWLLVLPFRYAEDSLALRLTGVAAQTLVGTASVIFVFALFIHRALSGSHSGRDALNRAAEQ
jgi:hypothetical protein